MIHLPQVTLWTCVCSEDVNYYKRVLLVLRHCQKLVKFGRTILFAHLPLPEGTELDGDLVQIPKLDLEQFGIFCNRNVPAYIKTDFALVIHEDGFILDPSRWTSEFLDYDMIGASWRDGVVGNMGFALESQKLLQAKVKLPFAEKLPKSYDSQHYYPSDVYLCRVHRSALEQQGVRFAPRRLAMEFSSEQIGRSFPTFGFHSKKVNHFRYWQAWNALLNEIN